MTVNSFGTNVKCVHVWSLKFLVIVIQNKNVKLWYQGHKVKNHATHGKELQASLFWLKNDNVKVHVFFLKNLMINVTNEVQKI